MNRGKITSTGIAEMAVKYRTENTRENRNNIIVIGDWRIGRVGFVRS
jgi:hypothetical protein